MPIIVELSGPGTALITAWLEVRVLPGPPPNKINDLGGLSATLATAIGDSLSTILIEGSAPRRDGAVPTGNQIRTYWWCNPPRTGLATIRPALWALRSLFRFSRLTQCRSPASALLAQKYGEFGMTDIPLVVSPQSLAVPATFAKDIANDAVFNKFYYACRPSSPGAELQRVFI
jgi:hypothetical protein